MIRNLKLSGLALVAALALSAVSATGVSATTQIKGDFFCDAYPCTISGEQPAAEKHKFVTAAGAVECEVAKFSSTTIASTTSSISVHPTYEKCVLNNNLTGTTDPTTVTVNGCYYTLTVHYHQTSKGALVTDDQFSGDKHLICPDETKPIEIHVFKATDKEHKEATKCTYHIKPQTIDNVDYLDHTSSAIDVRTTESPISVKRTSGSLLNCGAENQTAKYSGKVEMKCASDPQGATTACGIETTP